MEMATRSIFCKFLNFLLHSDYDYLLLSKKDTPKNLIKNEEKPSLKLHVFIYFSELCKNGINH